MSTPDNTSKSEPGWTVIKPKSKMSKDSKDSKGYKKSYLFNMRYLQKDKIHFIPKNIKTKIDTLFDRGVPIRDLFNEINKDIAYNVPIRPSVVVYILNQAAATDKLEYIEYILSNIYGFINILNASSKNKIKAIYYASSSSVYGDQKKYPVTEKFNLFPKNIYAKTKYLNEQIANFYYKKFRISLVGLRLFTVYGKWGRPDMLLFKIFKSHFKNNSFSLNNSGDHFRDFTHIDDVVKIIYLIHKKKKIYKNEIFNICSKNTIYIKKLVLKIKKIINIKYINIPKNKLEVFKTNGENIKIKNEINYRKFNKINNVLPDLIKWYEKEKIYKYY